MWGAGGYIQSGREHYLCFAQQALLTQEAMLEAGAIASGAIRFTLMTRPLLSNTMLAEGPANALPARVNIVRKSASFIA